MSKEASQARKAARDEQMKRLREKGYEPEQMKKFFGLDYDINVALWRFTRDHPEMMVEEFKDAWEYVRVVVDAGIAAGTDLINEDESEKES